jgi:hypothetical protein
LICATSILLYREILIRKIKKNALELSKRLQEISEKNKYNIKPLINDTEKKFFNLLFPSVGNRYYIFLKVPLSSIIETNSSIYKKTIHEKFIDFLLIEPTNFTPVGAINLTNEQNENTNIKNIFELINVPIFQLPINYQYSISDVDKIVSNILNENPGKTIEFYKNLKYLK